MPESVVDIMFVRDKLDDRKYLVLKSDSYYEVVWIDNDIYCETSYSRSDVSMLLDLGIWVKLGKDGSVVA